MAGRFFPVFTENFYGNLENIRIFLGTEGKKAFDSLLNRLFDDMVPTLCEFPQIGRSFLDLDIRSLETGKLANRLKSFLKEDDDIRQFIMDDYLILYLIRKKKVFFLSIKHHRQLSFDLGKFWQ